MSFALSGAHLLNRSLHLACVRQFALDELAFETLLDFRSEIELIVHALVLV